MRIISKFHDYYDSAATEFGQEPLFLRAEPQSIEFEASGEYHNELYSNHLNKYLLNKYLRNDWLFYWGKKKKFEGEFLYKDLFVVGLAGEIFLGYYAYPETTPRSLPQAGSPAYKLQKESSLEIAKVTQTFFHKLALPYPIWLALPNSRRLIISPILREYDFAKAVSPWEAAQKLDRYLSNQANPEMPIRPVDDITMEKAKGFDVTWSFRKPSPHPEKKIKK